MISYHNGAAIQASAIRVGNLFIARASILEEDGESTSLGDLGVFANREGACQFAVRCAAAFIDGDIMPLPPCRVTAASISGNALRPTRSNR
ncbi:hypothetical protein AWB76_05563 [Caballeronia temeraria]|uniref:Uncharacterized protein n=1 Tax=Caballeronia temeraria TaxID=1777137 RepID=A0A158CJV1_9BURK|nr:hypothetical protein [Caballeronia temeraria]SAK81787.1 hypothetical protein AWB76_05563 [Caballeronia temeraria]